MVTILYAWSTVRATADNAAAAKSSAKAIMLAERAYLTAKKSDFIISADGLITYDFTVRNEGKTPATVLGGRYAVAIGGTIDAPPPMPGYATPIAPLFLVPTHHITERHNPIGIGADTMIEVHSRSRQLWLMAFVDYKDQFGDFHRFGYGRRFDATKNELAFDASRGCASLNYDRPLTQDEKRSYPDRLPQA